MTQEELDAYGDPYLTGQWPFVVRAIGWLKKYKMKALLDLHAAPGSQNGWDNSGQTTCCPSWGSGDTVDRTLLAIERLSQNILKLEENETTSGVVFGIDLLNEPYPPRLPVDLGRVKQYFMDGYRVARKYLPPEKYTVVIDYAFTYNEWHGFMPEPEYQNVVLDLVSQYQVNLSFLAYISCVRRFGQCTYAGAHSSCLQ